MVVNVDERVYREPQRAMICGRRLLCLGSETPDQAQGSVYGYFGH